MKTRIIHSTIIGTITATLLIGCAPATSDTAEPKVNPAVVEQIAYTTTDGRHVTCLIYDDDNAGGGGGGIDCNWEDNNER